MYIPDNWIKNKNNESEIRSLISDCLGCLQFGEPSVKIEKSEKRLKELGEDIILKKLKNGAFGM